MKKTLKLEAVDPVKVYGAGNKILDEFRSYFPSLKIVARGDELFLDGPEEDIERFSSKFDELLSRARRKMNLTPYDVEELFAADGEGEIPDGESIIVYTRDGKPIRARNRNQQEMVKAYFRDDLIFVLGPAGTGKTTCDS